MSRLSILLLAPDCNPEGITIPLEGYCQAEALAQRHDVTLVARPASEDALRRAQAPFRAIELIRMPWLEHLHAWALRRIFKFNYRSQVLTAFTVPLSMAFEWRVWNLSLTPSTNRSADRNRSPIPFSVVHPALTTWKLEWTGSRRVAFP